MRSLRAIDLFCGAGGSSWGAREAGVEVVAGFDMWQTALDVYSANFPEAHVFSGQLKTYDPKEIRKQIGNIDLILASPECTSHSPAKGNSPRCEMSKNTAFEVTRFATEFHPKWIVIENVVSMRKWHRYSEFLQQIQQLGYYISPQILNAADFGAPQNRRRLYIVCALDKTPPEIQRNRSKPIPARSILDMNGTYRYTPLRTDKRAKATIERAERAIASLGENTPFLLVYYSSDHAGGWQTIDRPLRTITTIDRFALVKPSYDGHIMRMLQVPELKKAMGMPKRFIIENATRRDRIKMIGNAVSPPVLKQVVKQAIKKNRW